MNKKFDFLVIDCYNLMYIETFNGEETIVDYSGQKFHTEGIRGFLKKIEEYKQRFLSEDGIIYFLFDNAKTEVKKYRKFLSEDYKKTRVEQPIWFYRQIDLLELILKSYMDNAYVYRVAFLEADDYVKSIIEHFVPPTKNVLLISQDSDWFRSLASNVFQYAKGKIYDEKLFEEEYKFKPTYSNICFYKTFYGDKADNIQPTLKELSLVYFKEIINNFSNISSFLSSALDCKLPYLDAGWISRIEKEKEKILLNYQLVSSPDININDLKTYQIECKYQKIKLELTLEMLGLKNIDKRTSTTPSANEMLDEILQGEKIQRKE